MNVTKSKNSLRFSQHGVVISHLRFTPGPTHSVFDVLAAVIAVALNTHPPIPAGPVGVLGFAAGGMLAPLLSLGITSTIDACDLDRLGFTLFQEYAGPWTDQVRWNHAEAVHWLKDKADGQFAVLLEDLSIAQAGDITKPEVTWNVLPALILKKLKPNGIAIFNLLRPIDRPWMPSILRIVRQFPAAQIVELDEFENRILIAGDFLPSPRQMGCDIRAALRRLVSRQAGRLKIRAM